MNIHVIKTIPKGFRFIKIYILRMKKQQRFFLTFLLCLKCLLDSQEIRKKSNFDRLQRNSMKYFCSVHPPALKTVSRVTVEHCCLFESWTRLV